MQPTLIANPGQRFDHDDDRVAPRRCTRLCLLKAGIFFVYSCRANSRSITQQTEQAGREQIMNWEQVRGNWEQAKGELKVRWGKLTDDDLTVINGERDKLIGSLQEKYGITKEAAMKQIDEMT